MSLSLSPSNLTLSVRTRAEGMFSSLAHDLELTALELVGEANYGSSKWTAEIRVPVKAIRVVGVLKKGTVRTDVLKSSDVADIEKRISDDVFHGVKELTIRAEGTENELQAHISVGTARDTVRLRVSKLESSHGAQAFFVSGAISMKALALRDVKGPLGAFHLKDAVEIEAKIVIPQSAFS